MISFKVGGVPEHFNYPWHKAIESGAFEDLGIEVLWEDFSTGTGAMTSKLKSNELDLALLLTEGAIADITKGANYKILQVYVNSPLRWGIHVSSLSGIENVDQLQGKTYGISRYGSGSHLMAFVDADQRGWDTTALKFEIVNNMDGAVESFRNGTSDIFMWEKFTTKPLVDDGVFDRVGECPTPWPCFVLVVRDEIYEEYEEEINMLAEVVRTVAEEVKTDLESISTIAQRYQLKREDIEQWFAETEWNYEAEVPAGLVNDVATVLKKLDIIEYLPNEEDVVII